MAFIKRMWQAAPVATVVLALALVASVFFAVRSVVFYVYWHDPGHREQPIAAWMTPGYVAQSWHVPREVVFEALDVPMPPPHGPMDLQDLAASRGVPLEQVISEARTAIDDFRASHPIPGADRP